MLQVVGRSKQEEIKGDTKSKELSGRYIVAL